MKPHPSKVFVETTTRCNLRCPMCIKHGGKEEFQEGDMSLETFHALLSSLPPVEVIVLNGIGEPLLHPDLEHFVRLAKSRVAPDGWVGFQSNGLMMDHQRAVSFVDAGLDRICLSVDSISPDVFKKIRKGGDFAKVEQALDVLHEVKTLNGSSLEVGVEFVLRRDNVHELPSIIRWAALHGADFAIVTQLFPYHRDLVLQATYDANLDSSVSLFQKYAKIAREEDVDLNRYYDVFMKYEKRGDAEKVTKLVDSMVSEAFRQGLTLNLKKLFSMDQGWADRLETVFAETRIAASEAEVKLKLPEIVPKKSRRCEFVEEGCVFVSWDGQIHPCYFLWHHYQCFINGMEKTVKPKVFGNLSDLNLVEIWNDPAFLSFRKGVLRYDYPYCFNCSFALCDYVQGGDFEQDCYVNAEPCGICLWCMDVFQCLK